MVTKPKTPIDIAKVEELASKGLTLEQIASSLGISVSTLERRKREKKDLTDAIKRGRDRGIAKIANKLFEAACEGNVGAMIFYLKSQGGWKDKIDIEHSGTINTNVSTKITDKEREALDKYFDENF